MFTGIVEETGVIKTIQIHGHSGRLVITASKVLEGTKVGDSIAVNGICLTVVRINDREFEADIMAQTVRNSSLCQCGSGTRVNLERAMPANGRFGGHIVSGHIDGTGTVASIKREENAVWYFIHTTEDIHRHIIEKGSVCIDGISLTVAKLTESGFAVSVIPHTGKETALFEKRVGSLINLENDIVGKYIFQFMKQGVEEKKPTVLSLSYLEEHGFA